MPRARTGSTSGQPDQGPPRDGIASQVQVEDRGSFSHGVCRECGWRGPGRRARRVARLDVTAHLATCAADSAGGIQDGGG